MENGKEQNIDKNVTVFSIIEGRLQFYQYYEF